MIDTRFIFYENRNTFEEDKQNISNKSIAFIAESCTIYTHGTEFNCFNDGVSNQILDKLTFRLSDSIIEYSKDDGLTWETLIDLTDIENKIIELEGDISNINTTLSNYNTRISNLENTSGEGDDYTLPTANNTTLGGIRIGFTESNTNRDYAVKLDSNAKAYVHVPWEKGEGGGDVTPTEPISKYKAFAFRTVHYENGEYREPDVTAVLQIPTGLDSTKSIPTNPIGCTDTATITDPKDLIYMTSAWIIDGSLDGSWTSFTLMKDTTDFDVCFNSNKTKPSSPTMHGTLNGDNGWYNDVSDLQDDAVWMATSTLNSGTWSEWLIVKIKGEKGEDGTSIKIVGELDGTRYTSIEVLTTLSNGTDKSIGLLLSDGSRYAGLKVGDCFKVTSGILDGHIVCCNDDTPNYVWTDLGNILGPAGKDGADGSDGIDGESSHLHIKFSNDVQPNENGHSTSGTFTGNDGTNPGKYIGTLVDYNVSASNNIEDYKWSSCKGEDGFGYQYIYCYLNEYLVNNALFKTPKIDNSFDQSTELFYASMDGEEVSKTEENDIIWGDEQPNCDKDHPYIYRAYLKTNSNDSDQYWNGSKDGNRYPVLVAQYSDTESSSANVTQEIYYSIGSNPKQPDLELPKIVFATGYRPDQYYINQMDWDSDVVSTTEENPYLWKIVFTCYDATGNTTQPSGKSCYLKILSTGAVLAAVKGIGVEANPTGADWVYKGDWNETTKYERTSEEIPYISYGYVTINDTGETTWIKNKPTDNSVAWMTQYWYLATGNTEATGIEPGSSGNDGIWKKFHTDMAIAAQFLTVDQIVSNKISTAELNANQITSGKLNAEYVSGGSIKSSNIFIKNSNYDPTNKDYPWIVGGMVSTETDDQYALWIGSNIDGDGLTDDEILTDVFNEDTSEIPFKVTRTGKLYAKNAEISGKVFAERLYVGGDTVLEWSSGKSEDFYFYNLESGQTRVVYLLVDIFDSGQQALKLHPGETGVIIRKITGAHVSGENFYISVKNSCMIVGHSNGTTTCWTVFDNNTDV